MTTGTSSPTGAAGYSDKRDAKSGIESVRRNAPGAHVIDAARDEEAPGEGGSGATFELFRDEADEHRWRLRHDNGNVIADGGQGYASKQKAKQGLNSVKSNAPGAAVEGRETTRRETAKRTRRRSQTMVPEDTPSTDDSTSPTPTSSTNSRSDASNEFLAPGDDTPADLVDVLVYGLVGGVAGSVLSFVPFATVLGGAVAGYLCGGRPSDALKTGTVAGVVMTLPFVAVVFFLLFVLGFAGAPAEFGLIALFAVGVAVTYTLGSGIVGGILGHYLRGRL